MIIVTITPYKVAANDELLKKTQDRFPDASLRHRTSDPGRFALALPSKDEGNWSDDDVAFFNDLVEQEVLSGWAMLGGMTGQ